MCRIREIMNGFDDHFFAEAGWRPMAAVENAFRSCETAALRARL
jgi:hypothetical protein